MTSINSQQLAFILEIKKDDARAKMCIAWAKSKGEPNKAKRNKKRKLEDPYPSEMPISIVAQHLNLPTLQHMVDDICNNYLSRAATKKWILCDYPEREIKKGSDKATLPKLLIPPALRSMLPAKDIAFIMDQWQQRYSKVARI